MTRIIILVCSIYNPPDHCDKNNATDVIVKYAPFGIIGMAGQVEIADDPRGLDIYHYQKIIASR